MAKKGRRRTMVEAEELRAQQLREPGHQQDALEYNDDTVQAMLDACENRNLHGPYGSVKEMMDALEA